MVVLLSWESQKIGDTQLLKSTIRLAKKAVKNANLNLSDIGLIVHGGVFREHFRTEPAFSTHIQGGLNIHCTGISFESETCFSFDVTDGSCSPHIALQSVADMLPYVKNKYALLCVGDDRPSKYCEWYQDSYCVVAVVALVAAPDNAPVNVVADILPALILPDAENVLADITLAPVMLPPVPLDTILPTVTLPVNTPATAPTFPILALPETDRLVSVPTAVICV